MSLSVQKEVYTPENVFAGDFPVLTETADVGAAAVDRLTPVKLVSGKVCGYCRRDGNGSG